MTAYINRTSQGELPSLGKVECLLNDGASFTDRTFKENMVCVVNNLFFEAAAYVDTQQELDLWLKEGKTRAIVFLVYPNVKKYAR